MTERERHELCEMVLGPDRWKCLTMLKKWLEEHPHATEEEKSKGSLTDNQRKALFLWYGMIEKEAENAGVTFDMVIKHTHQLRITKEGLHVLGKQLQKALWGTDSTKALKKQGQMDILIDHFTDLFSKVGLELPPFPSDDARQLENLGGYMTAAGTTDVPEMDETNNGSGF